MQVDEIGTRAMVFLSEDDRADHRGLHEALLERAREDGMAGATVWRGVEGFGVRGRIRTARFPDALTGLPMILEVIDQPERIDAFLSAVHKLAPGSLVTTERVQMQRSKRPERPALDDPSVHGPRHD